MVNEEMHEAFNENVIEFAHALRNMAPMSGVFVAQSIQSQEPHVGHIFLRIDAMGDDALYTVIVTALKERPRAMQLLRGHILEQMGLVSENMGKDM